MSEPVAEKCMSSNFFKFEDQIVTEEHLKRAKEELGETPETRKKCLQELKNLIMEERNLNALTDEDFLLRFLRVRKFDVDIAFNHLKTYYMKQQKYPAVFSPIPTSTLANFFKKKVFDCLPFRNIDGSVIIIYRPCLFDPRSVLYDSIIRCAAITADWFLENPLNQIYGLTVIVNAEHLDMHHIFKMTPRNAHCLFNMIQHILPLRLKGLHIVNQPTIFSIMYYVSKPFLSKKLHSRLIFHGSDMKSLHKYIPPTILPDEFGGNLGPFDNSKTFELNCQHEMKFIQNLKYGYFNR